MRNKKIWLRLIIFAIACPVIAVTVESRATLKEVVANSPEIFIARCKHTPTPFSAMQPGGEPMLVLKDGLVYSDVTILSVLKGNAKPGPARVMSRSWLRQHECYMVVSRSYDGSYTAVEPYRIIPLGLEFPTNMLAGKNALQQIEAVFKYRLDAVNLELKQLREEQQRLEQALTK